MSIEIAPFKYQ